MKHSPEPWTQNGHAIHDATGSLVAAHAEAFPECPVEIEKADAERIVACVNALAGIPSEDLRFIRPKVDEMLELLEAAKGAQEDRFLSGGAATVRLNDAIRKFDPGWRGDE